MFVSLHGREVKVIQLKSRYLAVPIWCRKGSYSVCGVEEVRKEEDAFSATMKDFPPFRLDTVNQCLWRHRDKGDDERILLTPKAFGILNYLIEHAGQLVTHDELLDAVWKDTFIQPQAVKKIILDLRSALGDQAKNPLFIETLHRRGYRFNAAVSEGTGHAAYGSDAAGAGEIGGQRARVR